MNERIAEWPVGYAGHSGLMVIDYPGETSHHIIESIGDSRQSESSVPQDLLASDEMFACLVKELGQVAEVTMIIVNVPVNEVLQVWVAIEEDDESISSQIYAKEIEIMTYLSCYDFVMDFHVITTDMLEAVLPSDGSRVIYKR